MPLLKEMAKYFLVVVEYIEVKFYCAAMKWIAPIVPDNRAILLLQKYSKIVGESSFSALQLHKYSKRTGKTPILWMWPMVDVLLQ